MSYKETQSILIPFQAPHKIFAPPELDLLNIKIIRSGIFGGTAHIIQGGKQICEINSSGDIKINGVVVGKESKFSYLVSTKIKTWVRLKINESLLEARCVHLFQKRCKAFLGFHFFVNEIKFGYMVCELESRTTFKGSIYKDQLANEWFVAYSALSIRHEIQKDEPSS
jgi:hypothetical protein